MHLEKHVSGLQRMDDITAVTHDRRASIFICLEIHSDLFAYVRGDFVPIDVSGMFWKFPFETGHQLNPPESFKKEKGMGFYLRMVISEFVSEFLFRRNAFKECITLWKQSSRFEPQLRDLFAKSRH